MKLQQAIEILILNRQEFTDVYSVQSLALFGSVAKNGSNPASDIDLLVEFTRPVGFLGLFALQDRLQ